MIVSLLSLTFVACEKSDVNKELTAKDIEGTWVQETRSSYEVWWFEDGEFENEWGDDYSDYEDWGTYTVSDGKLKLKYEDGYKETLSISLKGDILTIDGEEYERK